MPDPDTVDSACIAVARALGLDPELGDAPSIDPSFDALRDHARWKPALLRYRLPVIDPRPAGR